MNQYELQKVHLRFSIPLIFSFLTHQMYSVVDTMMVGRLISAEALGAVGNAASATTLFVAISGGIEMGIQIVFSRYDSRQQKAQLRDETLCVACLELLVSCLLAVASLLLCQQVMDLLHAEEPLRSMSEAYYRIYVIGIPFIFLYDGGRAVLIGCGDSKTPFYLVLFTSVMNILLDACFIVIFHMGISGAAWATVLSQVFGMVLVIAVLMKKLASAESLQLRLDVLKPLITVAFPSMCQQLTVCVFAFILQGVINRLGTEIVTGYTTASKIANVYIMVIIGFSQGFSMMVSRKIGEQKEHELGALRQAAKRNCLIYDGILVVVIWATVSTLVQCFFNKTGHTAAFEFACGYLRIMTLILFLTTIKYLNEDYLKACMAMKSFLISNFADLLCRLVLSFILTAVLGPYGLCLASLAGNLLSILLSHHFIGQENALLLSSAYIKKD